jgi:cobalt-zinc-cadmium efflux system protein
MTAAAAHVGRLRIALGITCVVLVSQVIGSVLTGSLALLADAGHVATDAIGLLFALVAVRYAQRPATAERTYGFVRAEILSAVLNAVLVLGIGLFILVEAVQRWRSPQPVNGTLMLAFAVLGLVANGIALTMLHGARESGLTLRAAYLEVFGDLVGSAVVIVTAIVIAATGYDRADSIASVVIAALIVPRAISLLRDAIDVLMEATPRGVDLADIRMHITDVDAVIDVHDLHVWTLTSGMPVLSAHVVVDDEALRAHGSGPILDRLGECLAEHFDVEHCTFQIEPVGHSDHEGTLHP